MSVGLRLISGIALLLVCGHFVSQANAACRTTLVQVLGKNIIQRIQRDMDQHSTESSRQGFVPNENALPDEIAHTPGENLPSYQREDALNPTKREVRVAVDTYYGDQPSPSPDVHVMRSEDRVICLLNPGRAVFLSDGVTHHYSQVYNVDFGKQIITLIDPWSQTSFLLEGHNVAGVKARAYRGGRNQPLLDVTFEEFSRVLRGSVEAIVPERMFEVMDMIYPELAHTDDYLFWKYTRLLAGTDYATNVDTSFKLRARPDLPGKPKLDVLVQWTKDYIGDLTTGFEDADIRARRFTEDTEIPGQREEYRKRLKSYARTLPWILKWLLLKQVGTVIESPDPIPHDMADNGLAITESFLEADPTDDDFQIARAGLLIKQGRFRDALHQLARADDQWKVDLMAAIASPSAQKAADFLFSKNYDLVSLSILHWRYQRIRLMKMFAELKLDPNSHPNMIAELQDLQQKYVIGNFLVDFAEYALPIMAAKHDIDAEVEYLKFLAADSSFERASALYFHFRTMQSIRELPGSSQNAIARSPVGKPFCGIVNWNLRLPDAPGSLQDDLGAFCAQHVGPPRSDRERMDDALQAVRKLRREQARH